MIECKENEEIVVEEETPEYDYANEEPLDIEELDAEIE